MTALTNASAPARYFSYALYLGLFTVFYNLLEGVVSIYFGVSDETITLFGFGVDSFIEVLSGIGIVAMVLRIRHNPPRFGPPVRITYQRMTHKHGMMSSWFWTLVRVEHLK